MSGFSEAWLALREPVDHAARPPALVEWLQASLAPAGVLQVVDLAAGSGSNLRWLAPRLGRPQRWELIDHDPALLAAIPRQTAQWADRSGYAMTVSGSLLEVRGAGMECDITRRQADLVAHASGFDFTGCHLVTTTALLDLVSEAWLRLLVERCRRAACAVLFSLSYDGRIGFDPADPDDARLVTLVNRHQRTDKGFGPALGPDAWRRVGDLLGEAGHSVEVAASDWEIGADRPVLLRELLEGWVAAAAEFEPASGPALSRWRERRLQEVESGTLHVHVGHQDIAGVPSRNAVSA